MPVISDGFERLNVWRTMMTTLWKECTNVVQWSICIAHIAQILGFKERIVQNSVVPCVLCQHFCQHISCIVQCHELEQVPPFSAVTWSSSRSALTNVWRGVAHLFLHSLAGKRTANRARSLKWSGAFNFVQKIWRHISRALKRKLWYGYKLDLSTGVLHSCIAREA